MALTAAHLAKIRRLFHDDGKVANGWTNADINAVLNAIDTYVEATAKPGISAVITATAPGKFNAGMRVRLSAFYFLVKCEAEGF